MATIETENKSRQEISDVSKSIKSTSWGKILWNSCVYFNELLAENWLKYCDSYSDFELKKTKNEAALESLIKEKNRLVDIGMEFRKNIKDLSKKTTALYSDYIALDVNNKLVRSARKYISTKKINDQNLTGAFAEEMEKYNQAIMQRESKENEYQKIRSYKNETEKKYTDFVAKNKEKTKRISSKIKRLEKILDKCKSFNGYDITKDRESLYSFFKSEELSQRLLITVYSILKKINNYSFKTMFSNSEKEQIAEIYFNHIIKSAFNFDYIIGCYRDKNGAIEKIPNNELVKTIYNGYFLTIKGGLCSAFYSVYDEKNNKQSLDESVVLNNGNEGDNMNWLSDPENRNKSRISYEGNAFKPKMILDQYVVDESVKDFWKNVSNNLLDNMDNMVSEFKEKYNTERKNKFHLENSDIRNILLCVIQKISVEIMSGRVLGIRLAHIIVDAIGGVESRTEKLFFVNSISQIIKKYMCKYFYSNFEDIVGSEVDAMFSEEKTKNLYYRFSEISC